MRLLYGEIDVLRKILRQYGFLKNTMSTHYVPSKINVTYLDDKY